MTFLRCDILGSMPGADPVREGGPGVRLRIHPSF